MNTSIHDLTRPETHQYIWLYFLILFGLASLGAEIITNRWEMVDFEVYYTTAQRMLNGEEIYQRPVHDNAHYIFKYSPTAGIYFVPWTTFTFPVARLIYWLTLLAIPAIVISRFYGLINKRNATVLFKNKVIICSLLVILVHYHRELILGQVNIFLMSVYAILVVLYSTRRSVLFSFLLSCSLFVKPFGLIFLPYLLMRGEYKSIIYFVICLVSMALLPLVFYPNWSSFEHLYLGWLNELLVELGAKQGLLAPANHTIFSVLARFSPIGWLLTEASYTLIFQGVTLAFLGLGMLLFMRRRMNPASYLAEMVLMIALIPLLAYTSENAFIMVFPLVMYLAYQYPKLSRTQRTLLVLGSIMVGGNIYDIVGPDVHFYLIDISIYTFGACLLIACLIWFEISSNPNTGTDDDLTLSSNQIRVSLDK